VKLEGVGCGEEGGLLLPRLVAQVLEKHQPSEREQIVFFKCLVLYRNPPDSEERQCTSDLKKAI